MTHCFGEKSVLKEITLSVERGEIFGLLGPPGAVIAEEKEKNTLRLLFFANVRPSEYLLGIGSFVYSGCLMGVFACVYRRNRLG